MPQNEKRYRLTVETYNKTGAVCIKKWEKAVPNKIYDFIKILPKKGRILDAGFGSGRDSKIFLEAGFNAIGIEIADIFLKYAQKNISDAKFVKMDLLNLKFPENYFDGIWAHAVLLHIGKKDIAKALNGFYKILKPGGKMHISAKERKAISFSKSEEPRPKGRGFRPEGFFRFSSVPPKAELQALSSSPALKSGSFFWPKSKNFKRPEKIFTYFLKSEMENYVKKTGFKIILSELGQDELKRKGTKWIIVWAEKPEF